MANAEALSSNTKLMINQPYDECVEVPDGEEVASLYTPTPRKPNDSLKDLSSGLGKCHSEVQSLEVYSGHPFNMRRKSVIQSSHSYILYQSYDNPRAQRLVRLNSCSKLHFRPVCQTKVYTRNSNLELFLVRLFLWDRQSSPRIC